MRVPDAARYLNLLFRLRVPVLFPERFALFTRPLGKRRREVICLQLEHFFYQFVSVDYQSAAKPLGDRDVKGHGMIVAEDVRGFGRTHVRPNRILVTLPGKHDLHRRRMKPMECS